MRVNKGTPDQPNVRCRLVAQEIAYGGKDDELYAGTPSLAVLKWLLSDLATDKSPDARLMIMDIKSAFLYGEAERNVYIELPHRDPQSGKQLVGKLLKAMYGTRDAPKIWFKTVKKLMVKLGFRVSMVQPSLFTHDEKGLKLMVHVDEFLVTGGRDQCDWLYGELSKEFEMSCKILGGKVGEEAKYLNRVVKWGADGIYISGDTKHAQILLKEWGMANCAPVDTPMGRDAEEYTNNEERSQRPVMDDAEARRYRRATARVNFMAQDRPDLSVVSRIMSQFMAQPRKGDEILLKRVIRYLKKFPVVESRMLWQRRPDHMTVNIDSDWAGDRTSRKSTSGGTIRNGQHLIQHWSKLQSTIALSSGEAELNAAVKGTSEVIGFKEMLEDLRIDVKIKIETDASVCKTILLRHGCGKIKHLSTKQLWVQGAIESYGIRVVKVPRLANPADLLTHSCSREDHERHLRCLGQCRNTDCDDVSERG